LPRQCYSRLTGCVIVVLDHFSPQACSNEDRKLWSDKYHCLTYRVQQHFVADRATSKDPPRDKVCFMVLGGRKQYEKCNAGQNNYPADDLPTARIGGKLNVVGLHTETCHLQLISYQKVSRWSLRPNAHASLY